MPGRGVERPNSVLRKVVVVVEPEQEVDPEEVDRSVRQLRAELKDLDVVSVATVASAAVPVGAKSVDPSSLGACG